jgi:hypothetical protein
MPGRQASGEIIMRDERNSSFWLAIGICVGLVVAAAVLGRSLADIRKTERFVTVKGFAERDVKADLAVWPIQLEAAGNAVAEVSQMLETTRAKVLASLKDKGFSAEEITSQDLRVSDRQAREYGDSRNLLRYIGAATIIVRSKDVDKVQQVSRMTGDLVRAGVVLGAPGGSQGPQFLYTQLSTIKPSMITDATKNARAAADQFASDSGSKVGAIRRASQGLFSITDRDQAVSGDTQDSGRYYPRASDPNKRVRVVVTIDYLLE